MNINYLKGKSCRFNIYLNKIDKIKFQFRNLSIYLFASIIGSVISVAINPFLAANLSPNDYAIIGYFTSFNVLFLPIISFSLLSYYERNYFRIQEADRQDIIDTLIISQIIIGILGLLFILVGFYFYIRIIKVNFPFYPYAFICFIPVFFNCFYNFLLVDKRMKRQASSFFRIVLINTVLSALFALIFVVIFKKGAIGRLWSIFIPSVGFGIYGLFKLISKFKFSRNIFWDAIKFGWPISLSAILYYFLTGIDRAMLERLGDPTTFGIYNVGFQIAAYLGIFYAALSQTFEPDIYKTIVENNRLKLLKIVAGIIFINAVPTLIFILLANPVVKVLTYGRYTEATIFAQIIALRTIPMSTCFLVSNVIIGYGYPITELINRSIGAFLALLSFKILIDKFGFFGAAWGQSLVFVLMTLVSSIFVIFKIIKRKRKSI